MIIEQPARWLRWLYPHALWRVNPNEHSVYLTFDDGPIPEATPFILDVLDQYDAKATFFMVGDNVRKYPELFEEVKRRGHLVGNHTYHHLGSFKHFTLTYAVDVTKADALIHSRFFRPPHGWLRHSVYWWVKQNYRVVMWDVVTRDYSKYLTGEDVLNNVKRYTRNGSIITFHDSLKSIDKLRYALPKALEWLKNEGYEFKVFTEKD
ncbi:polysaccharide deacetylase family protein [Prevotella ihumii]|uniref:polysaccharide deacetylase family protein n=1 Tax=Prevotella ihumii TaxID=1917878 RepID=UPI000981D018|nr:polysaccharide deacetylase family protein [Prevotella ihumii]